MPNNIGNLERTVAFDGGDAAPKPESVAEHLRRLEAQWKSDTEFLSDADKIIGHPAFRAIIGLGQEVVPLLLRDLQSQPSLWVWALPEITGEDPVPAGDSGNIHRMTAAWLQWGRDKGVL